MRPAAWGTPVNRGCFAVPNVTQAVCPSDAHAVFASTMAGLALRMLGRCESCHQHTNRKLLLRHLRRPSCANSRNTLLPRSAQTRAAKPHARDAPRTGASLFPGSRGFRACTDSRRRGAGRALPGARPRRPAAVDGQGLQLSVIDQDDCLRLRGRGGGGPRRGRVAGAPGRLGQGRAPWLPGLNGTHVARGWGGWRRPGLSAMRPRGHGNSSSLHAHLTCAQGAQGTAICEHDHTVGLACSRTPLLRRPPSCSTSHACAIHEMDSALNQ